MLTAFIADDEIWIIRGLQKLLSKTGYDVTVVGTATDGFAARQGIASLKPDMIFSDIRMPGMTGLELLKLLPEISPHSRLILISGYAEFSYAQEAVQNHAFDYLLKPLPYSVFSAKMDRIMTQIKQTTEDYLLLPLSDGAQRVDIRRILYVESRVHTMEIHTKDGVVRTNLKMGSLEEKLAERNFFRCHKGYLVNLEQVEKLEEYDCIMGTERIPVSRRRKTELLEALTRVL